MLYQTLLNSGSVTLKNCTTSHPDACFDPEANLALIHSWCELCQWWSHHTTWSPSSLNLTFQQKLLQKN